MSHPHRGLPPPAAMSLQPQQVASNIAPLPVHHSQQPPPMPPPHGHHQRDSWGSASASLPPPPQHWQSSDESMRTWLQARAEEEKTKQEEEKTRQESFRLEQRKIEMDMLRTSLSGGIPPPIIPLVFAGMGGGNLPQAALEWAQQLIPPQTHQQLMLPQRQATPESHQRESVAPLGHYPSQNPAAAAGSAQTSGSYVTYSGSPTRARGQTISGVINQPSTSSNFPSNPGINPSQAGHSSQASISATPAFQGHRHGASQSSQHESSPSIYFHHWQPPASQAGSGSNRPGTPSGESQRKRKAVEPYTYSRASSIQRSRSPPAFIQSDYTAASASRRGHKRHKSDMTWYQSSRHTTGASADATQSATPIHDNSSASSRDRDAVEDRKNPVSYFVPREQSDAHRRSRESSERPALSSRQGYENLRQQHDARRMSSGIDVKRNERLPE